MKASLTTLVAIALLGGTSCVLAASSVDLTVKGLITPSACSTTLSQGGVADYGKIAARDLNETIPTTLPITTMQFSVTCEGATLFAFNGVDNRPNPNPNIYSYSLGLINGTQSVGTYYITFKNPIADGLPVSKLASLDNGATWYEITENSGWMRGRPAAFGNDASGVWAPIPITTLNSDFLVQPYIAATRELTLTEEQPLDGSATLELRYL
ncbi:DUF1120 domain-containing protein [Pseudomonas sp.]|uniref:DUF1120 domain-containing protein n=1 Tax=Pseudomonas sp. TaxID=306 RepID=UPI003D6E90E1